MLVSRDDGRRRFGATQEFAMIVRDKVRADSCRDVLGALGILLREADPVDLSVAQRDLSTNQADAPAADNRKADALRILLRHDAFTRPRAGRLPSQAADRPERYAPPTGPRPCRPPSPFARALASRPPADRTRPPRRSGRSPPPWVRRTHDRRARPASSRAAEPSRSAAYSTARPCGHHRRAARLLFRGIRSTWWRNWGTPAAGSSHRRRRTRGRCSWSP